MYRRQTAHLTEVSWGQWRSLQLLMGNFLPAWNLQDSREVLQKECSLDQWCHRHYRKDPRQIGPRRTRQIWSVIDGREQLVGQLIVIGDRKNSSLALAMNCLNQAILVNTIEKCRYIHLYADLQQTNWTVDELDGYLFNSPPRSMSAI